MIEVLWGAGRHLAIDPCPLNIDPIQMTFNIDRTQEDSDVGSQEMGTWDKLANPDRTSPCFCSLLAYLRSLCMDIAPENLEENQNSTLHVADISLSERNIFKSN